MKLSIIIVNYNVQYFLQNCLISVRKACRNIEAEVFVVDNNSVDGSVEMVKTHFNEVKVIANKENLGFSRANNQAIAKASGEYLLLLNPDTVVEEDTFEKCIRFMDDHPEAGGLGVRMIDGSGRFLPESKRGLPRPDVAFYKIFGMSRLFPRSRRFGHYHLGYIGEQETASVEILSGAFMFLRKSVIDRIGALDESFFMYGEDIDLSYRIIKAGYENYYFPQTNIIHYKGESTKKSSVNYVFVFYRAMVIFARKHFSRQHAWLFSLFINAAIYFRAFIALCQRFLSKIAWPVLDFSLLLLMMYGLKEVYERKVKFIGGGEYPDEVILISLPAMALLWVLTNLLFGVYAQPGRTNRLLRGISAGSIVILIAYALLDESLRFSRALVLIYCLAAFLVLPFSRTLLDWLGIYKKQKSGKRIAIVGLPDEVERVEQLLNETAMQKEKVIYIDPRPVPPDHFGHYSGHLHQLKDLCDIYQINEIIFCSRDAGVKDIIAQMSSIGAMAGFKIAPPDSNYIIGSSSNETSGEYYIVGVHSITQAGNKRKKRLFDLIASATCLLLSPFLMVFFDSPAHMINNLWKVLSGRLTFVGIPKEWREQTEYLSMKPAILTPADVVPVTGAESIRQLIQHYVRHYSVFKDLEILVKGFGKLDREKIVEL